MADSTVVVFGGSGFLGSHVADALTDAGFKVRIYDRVASPYQRDSQEMIVGDILDREAVLDAAEGCEFVYNFAGIADIDEAKDKPLDTPTPHNQNCMHWQQQGIDAYLREYGIRLFESGSDFGASNSAERFVEAYHERYGLPF